MNYTFAPDAPNTWKSNPNEWLTSSDLSAVMKHFEKNINSLLFLVLLRLTLTHNLCMVTVYGKIYAGLVYPE